MGLKVQEGSDHEPEELALQIAFPEGSAEGVRLADLIHCEHTTNGKCVKDIALGFNEQGRIGVMTRSILSCMYYLSQGIRVPQEHIENGMVRLPFGVVDHNEDWHVIFNELFAVRWSRFPAKNAFVSVKYHNIWFYIDNCDLASKRTFALLLQLYNLNAIVQKNRGPIISLPLR